MSILPLYFVIDVGSSMDGASIAAVNDGIVELFDEIASDPFIDDKVLFEFVVFNATAKVLLPLTQLSDVAQIPICAASGSSSYAEAFRLLKTQIESDVTTLRQEGVSVRRPCVFFISAGMPNDENWRGELDALVDPSFAFRPNIVSVGVAGAEKAVIAEVARWDSGGRVGGKKFFFMADGDGDLSPAIIELVRVFAHPYFTTARIPENETNLSICPPDGFTIEETA